MCTSSPAYNPSACWIGSPVCSPIRTLSAPPPIRACTSACCPAVALPLPPAPMRRRSGTSRPASPPPRPPCAANASRSRLRCSVGRPHVALPPELLQQPRGAFDVREQKRYRPPQVAPPSPVKRARRPKRFRVEHDRAAPSRSSTVPRFSSSRSTSLTAERVEPAISASTSCVNGVSAVPVGAQTPRRARRSASGPSAERGCRALRGGARLCIRTSPLARNVSTRTSFIAGCALRSRWKVVPVDRERLCRLERATVAARCARSSTRAISPKLSPGPRTAIVAVSPSGVITRTANRPLAIRWSESPVVAVEDDLVLAKAPAAGDRQEVANLLRRQVRKQPPLHAGAYVGLPTHTTSAGRTTPRPVGSTSMHQVAPGGHQAPEEENMKRIALITSLVAGLAVPAVGQASIEAERVPPRQRRAQRHPPRQPRAQPLPHPQRRAQRRPPRQPRAERPPPRPRQGEGRPHLVAERQQPLPEGPR